MGKLSMNQTAAPLVTDMKMGYIPAELLRRKWITWAKENLPSYCDLSGEDGKQRLAEANKARPPMGKARCYEHDEISFKTFAEALIAILKSLGMKKLTAVVGDPLSLAVFGIDVTDLSKLLEKAAADYSVITLIPEFHQGEIVIVDVPTLSDEQEKMLISTTGECEPLIDEVKVALPGGDEFRGN